MANTRDLKVELPTAAADLAVGLWQLEQRSQANPPDRAVLAYVRTLQTEVVRLQARNTELNERGRAERLLTLAGAPARYDVTQPTDSLLREE